jgi:hypothetical protein
MMPDNAIRKVKQLRSINSTKERAIYLGSLLKSY